MPVENVPGGQPMHALPLGMNPGGQARGAHDDEPAAADVLFGQGEQEAAEGPENVLTSHCEHEAEPLPDA